MSTESLSDIDFEFLIGEIKKIKFEEHNTIGRFRVYSDKDSKRTKVVNVILHKYPCVEIQSIINILIDLGAVDESLRYPQSQLSGFSGQSFFDSGYVYAPYIPELIKNNVPSDGNFK